MAGIKFSQLTTLSNILQSSYVAVLQAGKVYKAKIQSLLANYYTKAEVDQKIANVQAGGVAWEFKVLENQSLVANVAKQFNHDLNNEDVIYQYLVWNTTQGKYIKTQSSPPEGNRLDNSIYLVSPIDIPKFKLIFFG